MENQIKYSVVVPVYNSCEFLEELFIRTEKVFSSINKPYEIIFVDDYSTDNSWNTIELLKKRFPAIVSGIRLSKNFGQHSATMCGFVHAKGDYIITIDDDFDCPPEEIIKLIETQRTTHADLVYGIPSETHNYSLRSLFTGAYKFFSKIEGENKGRGSSFRLITRQLTNQVVQNSSSFVLIDEVFIWYTEKIEFTVVAFTRQRQKSSRYSLTRLFMLAGNQIIVSSTFPLKFMTWFGMLVAVINFLLGLRFFYRKIVFDVPMGYTSIIISVLFSTGIILFCLGVIGEYIGRILKTSNKVPSFSIDKKI
jgi:polyisoprenyl-phosphate glycosyltransferase